MASFRLAFSFFLFFRLFALKFSHGDFVFPSFHMAFFRLFAWRLFAWRLFRREKTKWQNAATIMVQFGSKRRLDTISVTGFENKLNVYINHLLKMKSIVNTPYNRMQMQIDSQPITVTRHKTTHPNLPKKLCPNSCLISKSFFKTRRNFKIRFL